jgi:hypothetical protein
MYCLRCELRLSNRRPAFITATPGSRVMAVKSHMISSGARQEAIRLTADEA